jgi:hypothetical protein
MIVRPPSPSRRTCAQGCTNSSQASHKPTQLLILFLDATMRMWIKHVSTSSWEAFPQEGIGLNVNRSKSAGPAPPHDTARRSSAHVPTRLTQSAPWASRRPPEPPWQPYDLVAVCCVCCVLCVLGLDSFDSLGNCIVRGPPVQPRAPHPSRARLSRLPLSPFSRSANLYHATAGSSSPAPRGAPPKAPSSPDPEMEGGP